MEKTHVKLASNLLELLWQLMKKAAARHATAKREARLTP
jgi:hypothetical protein